MRDLTWSRHQLEELAERRFLAAQQQRQRAVAGGDSSGVGGENGSAAAKRQSQYSFADLFKAVGGCAFCVMLFCGPAY